MSEPRYITFKAAVRAEDPGAHGWIVENKRTCAFLGGVGWYARWRCYVLEADQDAVFNAECLRDIATFMEDETRKRRAG